LKIGYQQTESNIYKCSISIYTSYCNSLSAKTERVFFSLSNASTKVSRNKSFENGTDASKVNLKGEPLPPNAPSSDPSSAYQYSVGSAGAGGGGGCFIRNLKNPHQKKLKVGRRKKSI
jgi:hypothetical protein